MIYHDLSYMIPWLQNLRKRNLTGREILQVEKSYRWVFLANFHLISYLKYSEPENISDFEKYSYSKIKFWHHSPTWYHIWYTGKILPVEFFWPIFTLFLIWSILNQKISVILKNLLFPKFMSEGVKGKYVLTPLLPNYG